MFFRYNRLKLIFSLSTCHSIFSFYTWVPRKPCTVYTNNPSKVDALKFQKFLCKKQEKHIINCFMYFRYSVGLSAKCERLKYQM